MSDQVYEGLLSLCPLLRFRLWGATIVSWPAMRILCTVKTYLYSKWNVNMPRLPNRMIPAKEGVVSEGWEENLLFLWETHLVQGLVNKRADFKAEGTDVFSLIWFGCNKFNFLYKMDIVFACEFMCWSWTMHISRCSVKFHNKGDSNANNNRTHNVSKRPKSQKNK